MAKLILITGAQAVGKMTVGEALKEKIGCSMTINHDSLDLAAKIYGWGTPAHKQLSESIRRATFESSIDNDVDLIFTYVWAFSEKADWDYVEGLNQLYSGELYIVELVTDLNTRLERNNTEHRKEVKPTKRDVEKSNHDLISSNEKYRLISNEGEVNYPHYVKIDNTNLIPEEVADRIIEAFDFSLKNSPKQK